jgi:hypothetical protein
MMMNIIIVIILDYCIAMRMVENYHEFRKKIYHEFLIILHISGFEPYFHKIFFSINFHLCVKVSRIFLINCLQLVFLGNMLHKGSFSTHFLVNSFSSIIFKQIFNLLLQLFFIINIFLVLLL